MKARDCAGALPWGMPCTDGSLKARRHAPRSERLALTLQRRADTHSVSGAHSALLGRRRQRAGSHARPAGPLRGPAGVWVLQHAGLARSKGGGATAAVAG